MARGYRGVDNHRLSFFPLRRDRLLTLGWIILLVVAAALLAGITTTLFAGIRNWRLGELRPHGSVAAGDSRRTLNRVLWLIPLTPREAFIADVWADRVAKRQRGYSKFWINITTVIRAACAIAAAMQDALINRTNPFRRTR